MRIVLRLLVVVWAISASARVLRAQEVGAYLGFGSAHDGSNGDQIETFSDGNRYKTPSLSGLFGHIGIDVFLTKHVGVAGEISWRPSQADYAGIPYRPTFYSFDALYRPSRGVSKKFETEWRAGLGGMRLTFFPEDDAACAQILACPSSHHFQLHLTAAARWYVTDHFFLRPTVDVHYVPNLSEFSSTWVPEYSFGVGYSLGRR